MENLRLIRERIKSCISCNEEQCPFIKERLDQHVLSHHSASSRPSISNHRIRAKPSLQLSKISPIGSRMSFIASDQETSTTDLNSKSPNRDYKENLRREILKWSKNLPVYRNLDFENLKQNLLNELIEKICELLSDTNKEMRDSEVKNEINNFVDSVPTYSEEQGGEIPKKNLKENLLYRINNIKNEHLDTVPKRLSFSNQTSDIKEHSEGKARDMSPSTSKIFDDNGKQTSGVGPINSDDRKIVEKDKNFADAEVQHSLAAKPHYNDIFRPKTNTNINSDKDLFKQQIDEWFDQILNRYDEHESRVSKNNLVNKLFDILKQPLSKNVNSSNYKLALKAKIFDFVDDLPIDGLNSDRAYVNNLAEDLANRLLCVKINTNNFQKTYYSDACLHECAMEVMGLNLEKDLRLKSSVYDVVFDQLHEVKFNRSDIINQITKLFYENISTGITPGPKLKVEVFRLLRNSSDLCDTVVIATINSIVKQLKRLDIISMKNNDSLNSIDPGSETPILPGAFSIYQSEHTLRGLQNFSATVNALRRSSILKKDNNNLNSAEKLYKEEICNVITGWMKSVPKRFKKTEIKQLKDPVFNNLTNDLIDQKKIEQIAPETGTEKKKYITFFILRWLNRVEFFKDLSDAKPYVVALIEKIESISVPQLISKNSSMVVETLSDLENNISHWLQEQPSNIYSNIDQNKRSKIIQKFAQNIQERLLKNRPSYEINKEIVKWLGKLIKPEEKLNINELTESFQNKIMTPCRRDAQRTSNIIKKKPICCNSNDANPPDYDEVLRELIKNYLEYYYDEDSPIARDAFGCIFKTELQKLRTPSRKQAYDDFIKNVQHEDFLQDRLKKELQYTSIVSDWLLTIPVSDFFNTVANKSRSEKVDKIVKIICDIDEKGTNPADTAYEKIISELPIQTNHEADMKTAIEYLSHKIASVRPPTPCCNYAYQTSSINSSGIQEQNLSDFIEEYVRTNSNELAADELKFIALTSHIKKEMEKTFLQDPSLKEYNKVMDSSVLDQEILKKFCYRLGCVKEITKWLNNLPLQPVTDKSVFEKIVKAIKKLAEVMSEKFIPLDTDSLHNNTELAEFITTWILDLPLLSHRNIHMPTATQQLINRVRRVNRDKDGSSTTSQTKQKETSGFICLPPHACCNKSLSNNTKKYSPAAVIVETIEKWCNDLPVEAENEMTTNELKDNIARKIYQIIGEINRKPDYFDNDLLYQRVLSDEIERQLLNLPQNQDLINKKEILKNQLLDVILENKNMIKEKDSGEAYKLKLEKTVELSMPYPIKTQHKNINYMFEIYKKRLVDKFILDNFDHSDDEMKINYEKIITDDIDEYFQEDQRRDVVPLSKDEVHNYIYSALFQVPPPKNNSMSKEVEEIKTKCEIDIWLKTLPLQAAKSDKDLMECDKILDMLAKRLHEVEKTDENPTEKMHREITKWLMRLQLLPEHEKNVDYYADELQAKLKSTEKYRKCQDASSYNTNKYNNKKDILGTSQMAGPSIEGQFWYRPSKSKIPACCQAISLQSKKPAELILEIVEAWCKKLPLTTNTQQEVENVNLIIDNFIIKIIMKISELNLNPVAFNDEKLYDALLEDELENVFSSLPACFKLTQSKNALKSQLIDALKAVKSLIKKENSRYEYKQQLKTTVEHVLGEPKDQTGNQIAIFHTLRDEIVDNFIEYSFNEDDIQKQYYKGIIRDRVGIFADNNESSKLFIKQYPLIKSNQLICELSKIPSPGKSLIIEEVQEIRLKKEITKLFNFIPPHDKNEMDEKNLIITTLAKRLNDYDKMEYTSDNKIKMKTEVIKSLQKLEANIDSKAIDKFIEDLEKTKILRTVSVSKTNHDLEGSRGEAVASQKFYEIPRYSYSESIREISQNPQHCQSKECGNQWMSLLSATSLPRGSNHQDASEMTEYKQNIQKIDSPLREGNGFCSHFDQNENSYQSFQRDILLSSSLVDPVMAATHTHPPDISHGKSNQSNNVTDKIDKKGAKCNQACSQQKQMLRSSNSNCSHLPFKPVYQMSNSSVDQSQPVSETQTPRYQQQKLIPRNLECLSQQNIGSVPDYCQLPQPRHEQSYTTPTSTEYPRNQTSVPEDIGIQQLGSSMPFPSNLSQRRASVLSNSGRPCRRPSITILSPNDTSFDIHNRRKLQRSEPEHGAALDTEEDLCLCERKQKVCKGNSCPTQQKYCRVCNGFKLHYCGPSPCRYPRFYYY